MAQWFDSRPVKPVEVEMPPPVARRWRGLVFQGCLIGAVAFFAVLALLARDAAYFPVDLDISRALQSVRAPWLTALMAAVSWPGFFPQAALILAAVAAGLAGLGLRSEAASALLGGGGATILNLAVKTLIARPRPAENLVEVMQQVSHYSFPSGHVMFYCGLFGFLLFLVYTLIKRPVLRGRLGAVLIGLLLLVGPSRIYLGGHWASDVLGAYLLGSLWLAGVVVLYRRGRNTAHAAQ